MEVSGQEVYHGRRDTPVPEPFGGCEGFQFALTRRSGSHDRHACRHFATICHDKNSPVKIRFNDRYVRICTEDKGEERPFITGDYPERTIAGHGVYHRYSASCTRRYPSNEYPESEQYLHMDVHAGHKIPCGERLLHAAVTGFLYKILPDNPHACDDHGLSPPARSHSSPCSFHGALISPNPVPIPKIRATHLFPAPLQTSTAGDER